MTHRRSIAALMIALGTMPSAPLSAAPIPEDEINRAQQLVFLGEHLRATHSGQTLVYDFVRQRSGEPTVNDQVRMTVTGEVDEARRDLSFEFLSGDQRLPFPDAHGYRGNPIAVQFLERDIRDMSQRTGTPIAHFRNTIRRAFGNPQIAETQIELGDRVVPVTEITVIPFADDAVLAKLDDGYTGKEYRFLYSEQIPGDLVGIRTRMTVADGGSIEEELRFHPTATP